MHLSSRIATAAILVLSLLGCTDGNIRTSNNLPEVVIQQPVDGSTHPADQPLELRGRAIDTGAGGGITEVAWTSDVSGVLFEGPADDSDGNTAFVWEAPEGGPHEITLRATDTAGATARETISLTIAQDLAPDCTITSPTGAVILDSSQPILLQGQVDDDITAVTELAIAWTSDIDDLLDDSAADETGVTSALVEVSAANHEIRLTVTDQSGLVCEDVVFVTTNGAPSSPGITFEPNPPQIAEDLRIVVTTPSVDPEGGDVDYTFRWFLDEEPFNIPDTDPADTIPGDVLLRDQVWLVEVRAADDLGVQSEVTELSTIVPDSPPGAPGVEVDPVNPTQAQDVVCSIATESVDPDGGDIVSYDFGWLRDGSPSTVAGPVLPWAETSVGEDWTCQATPSDGTLIGDIGEATATVVNGCFSFAGNGASSQVIVPDAVALRLDAGDFTVEAWVRPDSLAASGDTAIVSKRGTGSENGWHLGVDDAGHPFFHVSIGANPRIDAAATLTVGQWHHVAVVYDSGSGQGTFFVDGGPDVSGALPQPNDLTDDDLYIGNDAAGLSGKVWDGLIDDVHLSSVARYGIAFIPDTSLSPDADSIALWGFEEGGGTAVADLSLGGLDGLMAGGAFEDESTCDLDLAPTSPTISLSPDFPDGGDVLTCDLVVPSVDPEGLSVTYSGEWLVDGAPSGSTFTTFPATLTGGGDDGEEWTCHVVANDGAQDSIPAALSVFVGSMPICSMSVVDPTSAGTTVCGFEAPVDGMLRFTLSNPDASSDGHFVVDMGTLGTTYLFTGFKSWAYAGTTTLPWTDLEVELNVQPALGPMSLTLQYDPTAGTDNTGADELTVEFVFYEQLSTAGATEIGSNEVSSADASNDVQAATYASAALAADERLLVEAGPCGSAGLGAHGVYASSDAVPENDGLIRVDTGESTTCAIPLRSVTLPAGAWDFSIVAEDDFWPDNTGDRGLTVYRYTP